VRRRACQRRPAPGLLTMTFTHAEHGQRQARHAFTVRRGQRSSGTEGQFKCRGPASAEMMRHCSLAPDVRAGSTQRAPSPVTLRQRQSASPSCRASRRRAPLRPALEVPAPCCAARRSVWTHAGRRCTERWGLCLAA
jgi:hypothetical protein